MYSVVFRYEQGKVATDNNRECSENKPGSAKFVSWEVGESD